MENNFFYQRCPVCERAEKIIIRYPKDYPRTFLICADGYHAICMECGYRIGIPQLNNTKEVKE